MPGPVEPPPFALRMACGLGGALGLAGLGLHWEELARLLRTPPELSLDYSIPAVGILLSLLLVGGAFWTWRGSERGRKTLNQAAAAQIFFAVVAYVFLPLVQRVSGGELPLRAVVYALALGLTGFIVAVLTNHPVVRRHCEGRT